MYPFFLCLESSLGSIFNRALPSLYLSLCDQLAMFLVETYMLLSSGSEFIVFVLFIGLLAPSDIPLLSNMGVEVFDAFRQLLIGV